MKVSSLTRSQFAKTYGITTRTVDRLRERNEVRWYRLGGRIRILPIDEQKEAAKRAK